MLVSNWMTISPKVQPIGLDLGHSTLKMVQVAVGGDRMRVLAALRSPVDPMLDPDSPERRKAVVLAIRQLLAENDFKGHNVISALPVEKVKITSLRLAEVDAADAEKALHREAAERFGLDPGTDVIHYIPAGSVRQGDELKNEYILFAVENATIRNHIALLEEAGVTPVGIDGPPCALFRALERTMRRHEDREKTVIFLDVGYRHTIVVFGRAGEICFVKHIPIGTSHFDEEIASTLEVTADDAKQLRHKLHRDEPVDASTRRHMVDALNTTAERLAGEISLCLRYYTVTFRGKRVDRAVIGGGGAYEQVLLDVLRRHLSVEIAMAEPLRGFDLGALDADEHWRDETADLTLAVGLSLKGWDPSVSAQARRAWQSEPVLEGETQ
jgi:type IV pilus assembly protein PilM